MTPPVVLYDASVLYPSLIRNLLMHLAVAGLVAARWTDLIHDEWTRNLLADRPDLSPQRLARTRQFMDQAVPDETPWSPAMKPRSPRCTCLTRMTGMSWQRPSRRKPN